MTSTPWDKATALHCLNILQEVREQIVHADGVDYGVLSRAEYRLQKFADSLPSEKLPTSAVEMLPWATNAAPQASTSEGGLTAGVDHRRGRKRTEEGPDQPDHANAEQSTLTRTPTHEPTATDREDTKRDRGDGPAVAAFSSDKQETPRTNKVLDYAAASKPLGWVTITDRRVSDPVYRTLEDAEKDAELLRARGIETKVAGVYLASPSTQPVQAHLMGEVVKAAEGLIEYLKTATGHDPQCWVFMENLVEQIGWLKGFMHHSGFVCHGMNEALSARGETYKEIGSLHRTRDGILHATTMPGFGMEIHSVVPIFVKECPYCTSDNEAIRSTYYDQTCEGCVKRMGQP